jgi:hypothetical protein
MMVLLRQIPKIAEMGVVIAVMDLIIQKKFPFSNKQYT